MKKRAIRFLSAFLAIGLIISSSAAFASDSDAGAARKKAADYTGKKVSAKVVNDKKGKLASNKSTKGKQLKSEYDLYDEYIEIVSPGEGNVFYKGETMKVSFWAYDTWSEYDTISTGVIYKTGDSSKNYFFDTIYLNQGSMMWDILTKSVKTSKMSAGNYQFYVFNFAYDYNYDEIYDFDNMPYQYNNFKIKVLKAPTSLKTKVGKKKVKLTFKKATGAKKYEIYRSTKKSKGYKKIATIKKNKFIDKKVKRKKKYFYKIKTVRTGRGTVKSAFSKVVKTKKVK